MRGERGAVGRGDERDRTPNVIDGALGLACPGETSKPAAFARPKRFSPTSKSGAYVVADERRLLTRYLSRTHDDDKPPTNACPGFACTVRSAQYSSMATTVCE